MMHLWTNPSPVRKSITSANEMKIDVDPASSGEMNMYAKPLQSQTNNVHEMSKSSTFFQILENEMKTAIGGSSNSVKIYKHLKAIQKKYQSV